MCLGIPGEVIDIIDVEAALATVDVSGVRRAISVKLLQDEGIAAGDWVLVHVGFALSKIDEEEAAITLAQIQRLGRPYEEEMEAFDQTAVV